MKHNQSAVIEEIKAIQDVRRFTVKAMDKLNLDAIERPHLDAALRLVSSALTKLENQVSQ